MATLETSDLLEALPEKVGDWRGEFVYYCQQEQCMRSFTAHELNGMHVCPVCDGPLDQVSLGERTLLPPDTVIVRRIYQNERNESITVTIVFSGRERRSIHRPQQCLPAQGYSIETSSVLSVPLDGRPPLKLTLIQARRGDIKVAHTPRLLMAYWFAGGGHETHDHFKRMTFMAWDNLIHNVRPRWAYVSLQTSANIGEQVSERRLGSFVHQLYPLIKQDSSSQR